jgi:hypothetical protein
MKKLFLIAALCAGTFFTKSLIAGKSESNNAVVVNPQVQPDPIDEYLASPEFARIARDPQWARLGVVNRRKSYINYPETGPRQPIIHVVIEDNNGRVVGIIEAIKTPDDGWMPNRENYIALIRDYREYDFDTKTGVIRYYDLNYKNHLGGVITVAQGKVQNWDTYDIPQETLREYDSLRKKPHYCDKNQNGNVTFVECYKCMKNACDGHDECSTLCDLLGFGTYCVGTIGASCAIISIFW